ncbi:glycosyltransferase [candidate division KSB1 bacterium]|nr:glycosyltransferase [candidate division KSB1 bacterium]MBL7095029.1 glycosyltransferase [candidate division KSB1 bacterium]
MKKISVIISLYNIEDHIESLYNGLTTFLKNSNYSFELVFVDDGSLDATYQKIVKLSKDNPVVSLIKMRSQFGEASAFTAGLKQSTGDVILYFTARVKINPDYLSALITKLEQGNDLVVGWRYPRKDSKLNQIISKMFNAITKKLSKVKLHDINSGVFVTKREVLDNINVYGDMHNFIPVLAERQGYKIDEAKIEQLPGKFRKSKYFREYLQRLLDIITVIFLTNYSKKPIHFLGFVGALFTLTGAVIEIYLFVYRLLLLGPIAGRPLLLLGALLLVIGIQLISIGLLGEMIIFTHARDIKEYNIEEIIESDK